MPKLKRPPLVDREDWQEEEKEVIEEEQTTESETGKLFIQNVSKVFMRLCIRKYLSTVLFKVYSKSIILQYNPMVLV